MAKMRQEKNNETSLDPLVPDSSINQEKLKELGSLIKKIKKNGISKERNTNDLENVKKEVLLGYSTCLAFLSLIKAEEIQMKKKPVIQKLVRYRLILDKLRPIEKKLEGINKEEETKEKPDVDDFVISDQEQDDENLKETEYKPPKLAPVYYNEGETNNEKKNSFEKKRKKEKLVDELDALVEMLDNEGSSCLSSDSEEERRPISNKMFSGRVSVDTKKKNPKKKQRSKFEKREEDFEMQKKDEDEINHEHTHSNKFR